MNIFPFLFLTFFSIQLVSAQAIKIKKGIVSLDKIEVAKIEGEFSTKFNEQVEYQTLGGENIFTLRSRSSEYKHPRFEDRLWYDLEFASGGKVVLPTDRIHFSNKKLIERLLTYKPVIIGSNVLSEDMITEFKQLNDSSSVILAATEKIKKEVERIRQTLAETKEERNKKGFPKLRLSSVNYGRDFDIGITSWTTVNYDIEYEGALIGGLTYSFETMSSGSRSYTSGEIFKYYRRLKSPITINGFQELYELVAYQRSDQKAYEKLFTIEDGKNHSYPQATKENMEATARFLTDEGYL